MADGVVKYAVDKLEEMALQEVKLQSEVGKKVVELKDELDWLHTFLRHADQRRRQEVDDCIEMWVRKTRELAFDVEDVVEEFFHKGELHCHGCFDLPSFLQWLRHSFSGLFTRHAIFEDIKDIKGRLETIKQQRKEYNLEKLASLSKPHRKNYTDWSTLNEADIHDRLVGIDEYTKDINNWLLDEDQETFFAITGKSGIGKTALASYFYGRNHIRAHFDCVIWIHVPRKFRLVDLLSNIIQQASYTTAQSTDKTRSDEDIKEDLLKSLLEKKYLIVLDDVQSWEEWNFFMATLPKEKGSKVLITTQLRKKNALEGATNGNGHSYRTMELKKLNHEQGNKLFLWRVYGNDAHANNHKHLEKYLHGSPLNVVLLAGLLRSKKEVEWESVIRSLDSSGGETDTSAAAAEQQQQPQPEQSKQQEQPSEKTINRQHSAVQFQNLASTEKILTLSLDDLPPYLKPCFLYFAAFKAEAAIDAGKLVRIWVAEGFLQAKDGLTMEECGKECLKELISRCLIHLVEMDHSGNIVTVSIHQHVLDFVQAEANDTNFLQVHSSTSTIAHGVIRRLALHNTYDTYIAVVLSAPKLHSLLCEIPESVNDGHRNDHSFLSKANRLWRRSRGLIEGRIHIFSVQGSRFLRVMDLKGVACQQTLPEEIGWLIHLRYLGLSHTKLKWLPKSVKNLRNLQTLDISNTAIDVIPRRLWRIRALRHVLARKLKEGPAVYHVLTNLQTLHGVPWGRWAQNGAALKRMTNLRSIKACNISKDAGGDTLLLALTGSLECLTSMDLEAVEGAELPLQKLLTMLGLRHLQYLRLSGKVTEEKNTSTAPSVQMPKHPYLLPNLKKLELYESRSRQDLVYVLAKLPHLVELVLGKDSYWDDDMVIPSYGFPELINIELRDLDKLYNWSVLGDECALPQLRHVSIFHCQHLEKLPLCKKHLQNLILFTIDSTKVKKIIESSEIMRKNNPPVVLHRETPIKKRLAAQDRYI